jgi:hypothetical protein
MVKPVEIPVGITLSTNAEYRNDRPKPFKVRIRRANAASSTRESISESFLTNHEATKWIIDIEAKANAAMDLAMRGLEPKTLEPYMAGWRKLLVPTLGHIQVRILTNGMTDRAVHDWIADEIERSSVKNALAALVRVAEQAVRDGLVDTNLCMISGQQRSYRRAAVETIDPRALASRGFATLQKLADALVAASADERMVDRRTYEGWGDAVSELGCDHVRRHDLRHTALTWMADAVSAVPGPHPVHHLQGRRPQHRLSPARTARPATARPRRAADARLEGPLRGPLRG